MNEESNPLELRRVLSVDPQALGQVEYLLAEMDTWADLLPPNLLAQLRGRYTERLNRLMQATQDQASSITQARRREYTPPKLRP
jgi:hypothetical protein